MGAPPTPDHPTVLLLHELPGGTQHVDWMIAQDVHGRDPLITFRIEQRVDLLTEGRRVEARRIADHRPRYLSYEGPISGDRGMVRRLAAGRVVRFERDPHTWRIDVVWRPAADRQRLALTRRDAAGGRWTIEALVVEAAGLSDGA